MSTETQVKRIALIGNPNCGKTTVFNILTGANQRVGNWAGVTVEQKHGFFKYREQKFDVIDLPGTYTLATGAEEGALDEKIAVDTLMETSIDMVLNIVDASQLARHLYLTLQLLEQGLPVVLVLNMMDSLEATGQSIDVDALSKSLGCPVITLIAAKEKGLSALKDSLLSYAPASVHYRAPYPAMLERMFDTFAKQWKPYQLLRLLEGDEALRLQSPVHLLSELRQAEKKLEAHLGQSPDITIAQSRYEHIDQLLSRLSTRRAAARTPWTTWIDRVALNRYTGIPIFFLVMYSLFFFAINIGGAFQPFVEQSSRALFVDGMAHGLDLLGAPPAMIALLASGIGLGIATTLTFIPVIGAMFLYLSFLEDTGYMARAAFVMDRLMRAVGLPGKSFVPMIIGFGCNVPAVMAARTLDNSRDRILTTMMMPFMSCGARLAIFTLFVAAFFPHHGAWVVFGLYFIGVLMAVLTGLLLKKTLLPGKPSPLILELPSYRFPRLRFLWRHTKHRLSRFIKNAGRIIVPMCVLIGALNAIGTDGSISVEEPHPNSVLAAVGQTVTPLFQPMGIEKDNWPATVGLLTGILAKEVVVGTLNVLYQQASPVEKVDFSLTTSLTEAWQTIPEGLAALSLSQPVPTDIDVSEHTGIFGEMYQRFGGSTGAFAYLLFILLYMPCISTVGAMTKEVGPGWAYFSVVWTTGAAYGAAVFFYQTTQLIINPLGASSWLLGISGVLIAVVYGVRRQGLSLARPLPTPIVIG